MTRKAKLGFKYISLDDELALLDEQDFEINDEERAILSRRKELARKRRCYDRHKEQYNKQRRTVARSISRRYKEAKRQARKDGQEWSLSQEEWEQAWIDAGCVRIPGSQSIECPEGHVVPAFGLRGPNRYKHTCMVRVDTTKPWAVDNIRVMFRGEELRPGCKWFVPHEHST